MMDDVPDASPAEQERMRYECEKPSYLGGSEWHKEPHYSPLGPCRCCGDNAFCRLDGWPVCKDCWLEIVHGQIPPANLFSPLVHKHEGVSLRRRGRMPRDSEEDYFGDHDEYEED